MNRQAKKCLFYLFVLGCPWISDIHALKAWEEVYYSMFVYVKACKCMKNKNMHKNMFPEELICFDHLAICEIVVRRQRNHFDFLGNMPW